MTIEDANEGNVYISFYLESKSNQSLGTKTHTGYLIIRARTVSMLSLNLKPEIIPFYAINKVYTISFSL